MDTEHRDVAADAAFILTHAERLVKVATMCVISFGLAEGLTEALKARADDDLNDWQQATRGFQDATMLIAVLRTALLLDADPSDRDPSNVSFQTIYHRIKRVGVQSELKSQMMVDPIFDELFHPTTDELFADFIATYSAIDWGAYGRLKHFRNLGVAHLTVERLKKSITFDELRAFVVAIGRLTEILQSLCQTPTAYREWQLADYRAFALKTVGG